MRHKLHSFLTALAANLPNCTLRGVRITVPASSANLGPGFDCLAVAIDLPFHLDVGEPRQDSIKLEETHPAVTAFRSAGGSGLVYGQTKIPPGKGLGFSGAARVAGLAAASLQTSGAIRFPDLLAASGRLEGHFDNAAASIYGAVTATHIDTVVRIKCPKELDLVVWIPIQKTSTTASRGSLPKTVPFDTVASSIGRSSVMTAAIATSNFEAMRQSCLDDFHQPVRLAKVPESAAAIERALDAGACAAWLSGSGPTVAAFVESHAAQQTMQALPDSGHTKLLKVSQYGVQVS